MIDTVSNWLNKNSTGWVTSVCLIFFLLFTAFVLPQQASNSAVESGEGQSPDTSFYYTNTDLYGMAQAYGEQGRDAYIRARLTFDVVWPIVYMMFLATAISWLLQRVFPDNSGLQKANLVPIVGALLDYAENLSTIVVMARYPLRTFGVDSLAGVFTAIKWIFVGGSFVVLFVGILGYIWHRMERRHRDETS